MLKRLVKKDIQRSKILSFTILFFVLFTSFFTTLSFSMTSSLLMSIDQMMLTAKTPHLLYMHTVELNVDRMNDFVTSREDIADFQILEMINVEGTTILMVTHDSNVASYAHRVLFMIDGVLESEVTFENEGRERRVVLIKNHMDKYTI